MPPAIVSPGNRHALPSRFLLTGRRPSVHTAPPPFRWYARPLVSHYSYGSRDLWSRANASFTVHLLIPRTMSSVALTFVRPTDRQRATARRLISPNDTETIDAERSCFRSSHVSDPNGGEKSGSLQCCADANLSTIVSQNASRSLFTVCASPSRCRGRRRWLRRR